MTDQRTILIAGATGNIGRAATVALARRGARVIMLGRSPNKLKVKADLVRSDLSDARIVFRDEDIDTLIIDFSEMESVRQAATEALNRYPRIDGLVLSVGAFLQSGPTVLPSGHEAMFATNVMGPFLFTELLLERLQESDGLVVHVIATFYKDIDWDDLENTRNHKPMTAFNRIKTLNRMIAGETARRHADLITSVAFDPAYVIDKSDPDLAGRWPSGMMGLFWRMMTVFFAKPPSVAGEPLAELMLAHPNSPSLNGALFKLDRRIEKPDRAMNDEIMGKRLWDELVRLTGLAQEQN